MPEKLQIAVCDGESTDRQQVIDLTREIMAAEGLPCDLSGVVLLNAIQSGAQFHILLLDMMMDGLDGMELAATLRELGDSTAIIQYAKSIP